VSSSRIPLPGERQNLWKQFHGLHDRLYAKKKANQECLDWLAKMNKEQEEAEKLLSDALGKARAQGTEIDLKTAGKVLDHIRNAREYESRLQEFNKTAFKESISCTSMLTIMGDYMAKVIGGERPALPQVAQ
jgi:ribosomal protein S30